MQSGEAEFARKDAMNDRPHAQLGALQQALPLSQVLHRTTYRLEEAVEKMVLNGVGEAQGRQASQDAGAFGG